MANVPGNTAGSAPTQRIQTDSPNDVRASSAALDLNHASEHDIAEIDMIGKKLAHAIVQQRAVAGGFQNWDDLKRVPGLDAMKIAELQRAARLSERS